jgi:ornithine carbamoyltransferase
LLTIRRSSARGTKKVAFIGDGFSNMTRSWMWAAKRQFKLVVASPVSCQPPHGFHVDLDAPNVTILSDPEARPGAVINTDVYHGSGKTSRKREDYSGFQLGWACSPFPPGTHQVAPLLPAYRGKNQRYPRLHANTIFRPRTGCMHRKRSGVARPSWRTFRVASYAASR